MIVAFEHLAKGSFANPFANFKSISKLFINVTNVFLLVIVKAKIFWALRISNTILFPILNVQKVNCRVFKNLLLLKV